MAGPEVRAFLSYRHVDGSTAEEVDAHRTWVEALVGGLRARGVRVIWDDDIRKALVQHSSIDPRELPLCAEVSRAFTLLAKAFVPVVTPAYVDRLGLGDGEEQRAIQYGVVFEEFQGGAWLAQAGLIAALPILRKGEQKEVQLGLIGGTLCAKTAYDFRGDDAELFEHRLDALAEAIRQAQDYPNYFALFEPEPFCNFYIAWSRNRFPERARAPISVWWFNTGAASEFVPEVAKLALDSEGLDPNEPINRETSRLNKLAAVAAEPSAYEVAQYVAIALKALGPGVGWEYLEAAVMFAEKTLGRDDLQGEIIDRVQLHNNVAAAHVRIGEETGSGAFLDRAVKQIRLGLALAPAEAWGERIRLFLHLGLAHGTQYKLFGDPAALAEAKAAYQIVADISPNLGSDEKIWSDTASLGLSDLQ